jgi:hypothetical protein
MKPIVLQTIKVVAKCLIEKQNKPTTTKEIFDSFLGEVPIENIHYALRIMLENKTVAKVKHATYVLTDSKRPVEAYTVFKKKTRKPRKPRSIQPVLTLEKQIKKWDDEQAKVNFKDLCQKLQNALAKSYVDCDVLEATVLEQRTIIKYLESKVRETATV